MWEWFNELKAVFGAAAAVTIGLLIIAVVYQSRKLTKEQEAHHLTRDAHAKALEAINDKVTNALVNGALNTAQLTELVRMINGTLMRLIKRPNE